MGAWTRQQQVNRSGQMPRGKQMGFGNKLEWGFRKRVESIKNYGSKQTIQSYNAQILGFIYNLYTMPRH